MTPTSKMASRFATVANKKISQINKEVVSDNNKKATKLGLAVLQAKLCLFHLNLPLKPAKTFFVYK